MSQYHFVGLAGIGMSALAEIVRGQGHDVAGSDRYFDLGAQPERRAKLEAQGIRIFPQDGSGITPEVNHLVVSTAIEPANCDLQEAKRLGLTITHRASLLADLFHAGRRGVAITGSFGKTSICAMVGWALASAGHKPTIINGGVMRNFEADAAIGNAVPGDGDVVCIEADESDGTCSLYRPRIGVITGLARDHKELEELQRIYIGFAKNTQEVLIVSAQAAAALFGLPGPRRITFGLNAGDLRCRNVRMGPRETRFSVGSTRFILPQIGAHNVFNALAAIAVLRELGLTDAAIDAGLRSYKGVARRMELIGRARNVRVFDDFGHNPSKIEAAIDSVRSAGARRVLAVFQPHGFTPMKFMRRELVEMFTRCLTREDRLFLLPIYYTGGTTAADISSSDLAQEAAALGAPVEAVPDRAALLARLASLAQPHDVVLVMGARDETLTELCREILEAGLGVRG